MKRTDRRLKKVCIICSDGEESLSLSTSDLESLDIPLIKRRKTTKRDYRKMALSTNFQADIPLRESQTEIPQTQKADKVNDSKNSGASSFTSFSWTKDISFTSYATRIIAKSNDFVRINQKLPILKLIKVDNQLKIKSDSDSSYEEEIMALNYSSDSCSSKPASEIEESDGDFKRLNDIERDIADRIEAKDIETYEEVGINHPLGSVIDIENEDDDDVISLYAESISELECSKNTRSFVMPTSSVDTKPTIVQEKRIPIRFDDLKVKETQTVNDLRTKIDALKPSFAPSRIVNVKSRSLKITIVNIATPLRQRHNKLFQGVCIFNLMLICKNVNCSFAHKHIPVKIVEPRLRGMSEETFIQELMFILKWPQLHIKYGIFFVEECSRRQLTQLLIIAIKNFVDNCNRSREFAAFCLKAVKATLLHLNDADLECCYDQLQENNLSLCEYFMKVIAENDNLFEFKKAFIKLTYFMCRMGRLPPL